MPLEDISVTTMAGYTTIHQVIKRLGGGVGVTDCWECGGDGDWSKFAPWNPPRGSYPCVNCKGTGRRYIMAY